MAQKVYKRSCSNCGGRVSSHHATFKVQLPRYEHDAIGRPTQIDGVREVTCQGLGTWGCERRCQPCKVTTVLANASAVGA
jgi:hypothetical protein